jgi:hypothetical protein
VISAAAVTAAMARAFIGILGLRQIVSIS